MKRILCILLTLALLIPMASSLAEKNDYTSYAQFPLVKEGESLTISVAVPRNESYGRDPEDTWFWVWSEYATGADFEVRQIMESSVKEQKNLMFAADDLPDLMLGLQLTTGELMRYGMQEGQLLDLTPYINAETMPYLTKWFEAYPQMKAMCTTPDGKIYTIPYTKVNSDRIGSQEPLAIKKTWLEAAGAQIPETLDEFIALMRKFKELYPDSTPMSGTASDWNPLSYLLNALGYLTNASNDYGYEVALREGKVVIPAIDPTFKEWLSVCSQFYAEGIISKDFFTADDLTVAALMTEDKTALFAGAPYWYLPEIDDFHQWDSCKPLTSEWNAVKQYKDSEGFAIGGCVLSADTEHAEEILKYIDFFFSELGIYYMWEGPLYGSPDTLGMVQGFDFQDGGKYFYDVKNGTYESSINYVYAIGLGLANAFGNRSHSITYPDKYTTMMETLQYCLGIPDDQINRTMLKYDHGDNYNRLCMQANIQPYVTAGFPSTVYYDEETQAAIDEITILLNSHVESEVAKFITGARSLSEFDQFVAECKELGAEELQAIYAEAYANYLAAL